MLFDLKQQAKRPETRMFTGFPDFFAACSSCGADLHLYRFCFSAFLEFQYFQNLQ